MIVITTPTGQVGGQVLARVLDSGEAVRVIARDPSRLPPDVRSRVEVVVGSHGDAAVVKEAFAGADSVFWVMPPNPYAPSVEEHLMGFARSACAAAGPRFVALSTLGRGIATNAGLISVTLDADELIRSTGVAYRALCPPGFMENVLNQTGSIAQGVFTGVVAGSRAIPVCATRDIAAAGASLLLDESWDGQADVPLLGPEDLSHDDMARIMSTVLARPVRYHQISGEEQLAALTGFGISESMAQGMVDMYVEVDEGLYNAEPRTPESTTPTGFRQWCEEVLKPAVLATR